MKTSFLPRLVNGQSGDPALFVDLIHEKRALLFDCGRLDALSAAELLRITDVFVSHTHIDHFIGFDHLLRLHMGRPHLIRIYGPRGINSCVRGKLSGYAWNLVQNHRLVFEVHEWAEQGITLTRYLCRKKFRQPDSRLLPASNILWRDDLVEISCEPLDHFITTLAFRVTERDFYNIDPVRLRELGLRPGPWLNQLKNWARSGSPAGVELQVDGRNFPAAELGAKLLIVSPGRSLAYVADCLGSEENLERIARLAHQADILFCEAAFLEEDRERARKTRHLTALEAGTAARRAGAKRLVVFHFSPKYEGRFSLLDEEAQNYFEGSSTSPEQITAPCETKAEIRNRCS